MDSRWLKAQFDHNPEKSKAALARALNLEPPAISKILNGTRQIKAAEYLAMRVFFGLPIDGEKSTTSSHSTLEPLHAGSDLTDNPFDSHWKIPSSILQAHTKSSPQNIKIFKVEERLMEPDFSHGEHVLVDLADCKPSPEGAFVVSDGFGFMVRHCSYVAQSDPPKVKITARKSSFSSQTLPLDEFQIIGRVIAKLEWMS